MHCKRSRKGVGPFESTAVPRARSACGGGWAPRPKLTPPAYHLAGCPQPKPAVLKRRVQCAVRHVVQPLSAAATEGCGMGAWG